MKKHTKSSLLAALTASLFIAAGCHDKDKEKKKETRERNEEFVKLESFTVPSEGEQSFAYVDEFDASRVEEEGEQTEFAGIDDQEWDSSSKIFIEHAQEAELEEGGSGILPLGTIKFGFDSANLSEKDKEAIKLAAVQAKELVQEGGKVVVFGHTDQVGTDQYNDALSKRRAEAVRKEMAKYLPKDKIEVKAMGSREPVVEANATERLTKIKTSAPNRRAEIAVEVNS